MSSPLWDWRQALEQNTCILRIAKFMEWQAEVTLIDHHYDTPCMLPLTLYRHFKGLSMHPPPEMSFDE